MTDFYCVIHQDNQGLYLYVREGSCGLNGRDDVVAVYRGQSLTEVGTLADRFMSDHKEHLNDLEVLTHQTIARRLGIELKDMRVIA